ncbi:CoA-binding protein [Bacteroidia bacterium]|nr:CoA-binding protein [Bacteroidia bacterium]MDB9883384.1 CoA-binding protein [Bacteroidia bacterium]
MQQSKKTLIIGATHNPSRYAYIATEMLLDYKHEVVLYGIKKGSVLEIPILNDWPSEEEIDTITMYVNPLIQEAMYLDILALKPSRIIFNPGTENKKLADLALSQNIATQNECTLVLLRTNQY